MYKIIGYAKLWFLILMYYEELILKSLLLYNQYTFKKSHQPTNIVSKIP